MCKKIYLCSVWEYARHVREDQEVQEFDVRVSDSDCGSELSDGAEYTQWENTPIVDRQICDKEQKDEVCQPTV